MRAAGATISRGAKQQSGGVSLFPFLAVLICTMGSLIVILVVLARQAKLQAADAAHEAASKVASNLQEIEAEREVAQWEADALAQSRAATEAQMAEANMLLGGIEEHIASLTKELNQLQATIQQLATLHDTDSQQRQQLEAELARLQAEIATAKKQLAAAEEAARGQQNSYAIIPYEGANKTHRRPIYIECRSDAIVLQPEGIHLTEEDFTGVMGPGNPLASALRAGREYLTVGQTADGAIEEPYPLLLVRPDGITAYYAAREAMESWGSEFGYELIGQNWKLKYPPPDPGMTRAVHLAVDIARKRQEKLAEIAPRPAASGVRPIYRAAARGIVQDGYSGGGDGEGSLARPSRPAYLSGGGGRGESEPGGTLAASGQAVAGHPMTADASGYPDGESGPYAATPQGRVFGSRFESGGSADATAGVSGSTGGAEGQPGGETLTAGGQAAAERPEDYIAGRPTEADPSMAGGGRPLRPGEWEPVPDKPSKNSPLSVSTTARNRPDSRMQQDGRSPQGGGSCDLTEARGRDWALPGAARGAIPIARPIRIDCHANHLAIAPDGRLGGQNIQLGPRTRDSVDAVISAVWDHMDTWGIAGRGLYWRPVLTVHVNPDAESRYEDLKALLEGSGLNIERK